MPVPQSNGSPGGKSANGGIARDIAETTEDSNIQEAIVKQVSDTEAPQKSNNGVKPQATDKDGHLTKRPVETNKNGPTTFSGILE